MVTLSRQPLLMARDAAPTTAATSTTCNKPRPKICLRSDQSRDGSSSNPTRNNMTMTPNSAKCITSPEAPCHVQQRWPDDGPRNQESEHGTQDLGAWR